MAASLTTFSNELAGAAEQAGKAVVTVGGRHRMPSSGVQWRKGVIVTANHSIRREEEITVLVDGGKRLAAKLAGRDPGCDLAILKIEDAGLPEAQLGDAADAKLAQVVLALGRTRQARLVASAGIIGGLAGEWRTWRGGRIDQAIRLDLNLYPGFSGGPLVSTEGKVLGINTSGLSRGRAVTVPAATVNRSVDELLAKGHIARPYLGIAMQAVAVPEKLRKEKEQDTALLVVHAEAGGPAEAAGVVLGDVIVQVNGKPADELQEVLLAAKTGDRTELEMLRGGKPVKVTVTLGERPVR
jgi:S1-C subfamily serine protease